jgi:GDP/UDP-N,N'-diacetylbacillosamine 2-epimerase (hydrolysing)
MRRESSQRRRVCFVTGTRAEFGLMQSVLRAIEVHPQLELQFIVTGMHLDRRHGRSVDQIRRAGWLGRCAHVVVPWKPAAAPAGMAAASGRAMAGITAALEQLQSDVVLLVGDRVEAFAAAAAGHLGGRVVAHVHGGDRALGQVDDALRHAITKLAHVHFPATATSAARIHKLGEEKWRIHRVGSPGLDGIGGQAAERAAVRHFFPAARRAPVALVVLHPTEADESAEYRRAKLVLECLRGSGFSHRIIVYPNNDPGARGIIRCWEELADPATETVVRDLKRPMFLAILRQAGVLVGNSSSGIIEAASFGTPVIDLGVRQQGRERGVNVVNVPFAQPAIERELRRIYAGGRMVRYPRRNVYGGAGTGKRIASVLANLPIDTRLVRKLICY